MSAGPLGNRTRTENKSGADGVNDAEDKIGTKRVSASDISPEFSADESGTITDQSWND